MTFLTLHRVLFLETLRWIASVAASLYIGLVPSARLKSYHEKGGEKEKNSNFHLQYHISDLQ